MILKQDDGMTNLMSHVKKYNIIFTAQNINSKLYLKQGHGLDLCFLCHQKKFILNFCHSNLY